MSRETNEEVVIYFKTVTMNLFTIVQLIFETITSLAKPKASLEAYFSISQLPCTVNSSKPVISPSLFSFFFFGNMIRSNRYSWGTVDIHVGNSADSYGGRNTTIKLKLTESRNYISIIKLIKGGYVLSWGPSIRWNLIVEEILSKSFREFSDTDQFFVVVSLNTITKQFPTISNSNYHSNCRT